MLTSVSILKRGYWAFDRAWLPPDEFEERVGEVQRAARAAGLGGLVIFGDADDYADSAYLSGMPDGTTVIVPAEGEPLLLGVSMWRELPFLRTLTWISDFRVSDEYGSFGEALAATLDSVGLGAETLGVAGFEVLSPRMRATVTAALAGRETRPFDAGLRALRAPARPREVALVTALAETVAEALAAAHDAFAAGGGNAEAYIAAERAARLDRARDFRGLVNGWGGDLRPYEGRSADRHSPLTLYVAVERQGYWADGVLARGDAAGAAVAAMAEAAQAGTTAGAVAAAALAELPPELHETALLYGFGNGIGLGLHEPPFIAPGAEERLVEGALLSLRVLGEQCASALVQVGGRRLP